MASRRTCETVSSECPVSLTTYGYVPSLPGNAFFAAVFGLCLLVQLRLGIHFRSWTFLIALGGGCLMEMVGYIGRIQMHDNVWDRNAFRTQICCLILAPSLIAAGIYLSLKHIVRYLDRERKLSLIRPELYTWIFIICDLVSIFIQAAGGGIAASAGDTNIDLINTGNNLMIAGIAFQVVTMGICGLLALVFAWRYKRSKRAGNKGSAPPSSSAGSDEEKKEEGITTGDNTQHPDERAITPTKFKIFCAAEILAFVAVLIRCIYRLPEMAGGWGNPLMRNETEFMILDGMMIAMACLAFTIFHPGLFLPTMTGRPGGIKAHPLPELACLRRS